MFQSFSKHKLCEIYLAASFVQLQKASLSFAATVKLRAAQVGAGGNGLERTQNCRSCVAVFGTEADWHSLELGGLKYQVFMGEPV